MSERNGQPWTDRETRLLGTAADRAIAEKIGRTARAVETERRKRGIPSHTPHRHVWTEQEAKLLGKLPDSELAQLVGLCRRAVLMERARRGIRAACPENRPKWLDSRR